MIPSPLLFNTLFLRKKAILKIFYACDIFSGSRRYIVKQTNICLVLIEYSLLK